ncbi:MAG: Xaa-Pro peptidase family protein [Bryobacteraceae bacterium]|jgi:Xaa-Pro aminopeptidase
MKTNSPISAVAEQFADLKIDAFLVSAPPNVRYLSGFTGSNALLLVESGRSTLFTDPRYTIQASEETSGCTVKTARGPLVADVAHFIARRRLKRIGFERGRLLFDSWQRLKETLPLGASLKPVGPVVEELRTIKSPEEIARIRASVLVNSLAFEAVLPGIRPGVRESDIAAELEYQMRRQGAEKPSFETLVASGPRSALVHAQPTSEPVGANQLLLIDMGATRNGYVSDMTRTLFLGRPGRKVRNMYDSVLMAQLAGIAAVREGVTAEQVDRAARRVLRTDGLDKAFVHSTGHGLGLEIHEPPRLGKKDKTRLRAGMAITIEPGVYVEGFGGIRIEDTVVVTASGCEVLTPTTKEFLVL